MQSGRPIDDPAVAKALAYIDKFRHADDGGYYAQGQKNYTTSCVLSAFASLPEAAKADYAEKIAGRRSF